mmetsp:Transcript_19344/g.35045  ORF Transcript_19344/g.35045 Transcript_19344/m.35045 type:complete len:223 (+) Transcript_19344:1488-2156(+)
MDDGTNVGKRQVSTLLQYSYTLGSISQEESIVVPTHDILTHVGNLEHLAKLVRITREKVQEGETIKVLGTLVTHFHNLVVTLTKGFTSKLAPDVTSSTFLSFGSRLLLDSKCTLHCSFNVTTSKSKTETSTRLSHKVESNLWKSLGLKVGDDCTAAQATVANHVHDLSIFFVGKSQLETSFRRINTENTATSLPIQTKELILDNALSIERIIQGTNGASVSR